MVKARSLFDVNVAASSNLFQVGCCKLIASHVLNYLCLMTKMVSSLQWSVAKILEYSHDFTMILYRVGHLLYLLDFNLMGLGARTSCGT